MTTTRATKVRASGQACPIPDQWAGRPHFESDPAICRSCAPTLTTCERNGSPCWSRRPQWSTCHPSVESAPTSRTPLPPFVRLATPCPWPSDDAGSAVVDITTALRSSRRLASCNKRQRTAETSPLWDRAPSPPPSRPWPAEPGRPSRSFYATPTRKGTCCSYT